MLSGEGIQRRKTVKNNNKSNQQKQLCTCRTLFCTFVCRFFARLQGETSRNFLVQYTFYGENVRPQVAASISHFVTAATKFSCCSSNKKMSPLFFISRSKSMSPSFSLSFAGLPPSFSFRFPLSYLLSLFLSLLYKTPVAMRFPVKITSSCIQVAVPVD